MFSAATRPIVAARTISTHGTQRRQPVACACADSSCDVCSSDAARSASSCVVVATVDLLGPPDWTTPDAAYRECGASGRFARHPVGVIRSSPGAKSVARDREARHAGSAISPLRTLAALCDTEDERQEA